MDTDLHTIFNQTYIGGTNDDNSVVATVNNEGKVVVAGTTKSSNYPTTPGAYDSTLGGVVDITLSIFSGECIVQHYSDLSITKTVDGDYTSGGLVGYTLTYTNDGPDFATGIIITDVLGTGLSGMSASPSRSSRIGNQYIWSGINLASGASASIYFTAMVVTGTTNATLYNTVSINYPETDLFLDNNTASA